MVTVISRIDNKVDKFVHKMLTQSKRKHRHQTEDGHYEYEYKLTPPIALVMIIKLLIYIILILTGLELAHLLVLNSWNSEIWSGITTILGLIGGILLGRRSTE